MKIAYFHDSIEYRTEFSSRDPLRPTFYWFSDRFHDHYGYGIDNTYFYLFVKDPISSNISMRARGGTQHDFHDLYADFVLYKNEQVPKLDRGELEYAEPPILMSFDRMTPELIAVYHKNTNEYEILYPEASAKTRFRLYDVQSGSKWPVGTQFTDVPELTAAVPELCNALPFQEPGYHDGRHVYDRWVPMVTEKNGTWL